MEDHSYRMQSQQNPQDPQGQMDQEQTANSQGNNFSNDEGKLFIGGLSWNTTQDGMKEYFTKYGDVTDVIIMTDKWTGNSRGFGFVTFADVNSATTAVKEIHVIDGKQVEAKRAIPEGTNPPRRDRSAEKVKKIFVGGLSHETSEDAFRAYFENFGPITDAQIMSDPNSGKPRGFGFITFESEETVDKVLGQEHSLNEKFVDVKKAEPRNKRGGRGGGNYNSGRGGGRNYGGQGQYNYGQRMGRGGRGGHSGQGGQGGQSGYAQFGGGGYDGNFGYSGYGGPNPYTGGFTGGFSGEGTGYGSSGYGGSGGYNVEGYGGAFNSGYGYSGNPYQPSFEGGSSIQHRGQPGPVQMQGQSQGQMQSQSQMQGQGQGQMQARSQMQGQPMQGQSHLQGQVQMQGQPKMQGQMQGGQPQREIQGGFDKTGNTNFSYPYPN